MVGCPVVGANVLAISYDCVRSVVCFCWDGEVITFCGEIRVQSKGDLSTVTQGYVLWGIEHWPEHGSVEHEGI